MKTKKLPSRPLVLDAAAYKSVCDCKGVSARDKARYLNALNRCGSDINCAEATHAKRCKGYARKGPAPSDLLPDEGLGALVEENNFIKFTSKAFGLSIGSFRKKLDAVVSYYQKRASGRQPTETERLEALSFMLAKVPARSDGTVWLFRNPTRDRDAYAGVTNPWLGHRLGLNLGSIGETRLTLGFFAAHAGDLRRPTFRDVSWSFLPLWGADGKTKPLPRTPRTLGGFYELVSEPPALDKVNRPITRLKLQPR